LTKPPAPPEGPIRRAARNAVWLLAGKGAGGVFSLIYLALTAQTLGPAQFGIFALILSYGQAITNLAQFQSWQTVVRYGAHHEASDDKAKLRRLITFAALLDLGAAVAGTILAIAGIYLFGKNFGWSAENNNLAALFCLSLLLGLRGAPTGILRLFNRFDLAAYAEAVLPSMRLMGALIAWASGASIAGYLAAWAFAELATTIAIWWASIREVRKRFDQPHTGPRLRGVTGENEGLWAFSWTTNLNTSLNLVWKQFPVLAVGWAVDAVAAGGFRIATQLIGALNKPTIALSRALFPELAKLTITDRGKIRQTVQRTGLIGAAAGVIMLTAILLLGKPALHLFGGGDYNFVFPLLLVLGIGAVFDLSGVAIEPALVALGRPGIVLRERSIVSLLYLAGMVFAVQAYGALGAAAASSFASLFLLLLLFSAFRRYSQN
jgi:O-antigen/teichoic acid export membrane protein